MTGDVFGHYAVKIAGEDLPVETVSSNTRHTPLRVRAALRAPHRGR